MKAPESSPRPFPSRPGLHGHDGDWQYPAITEQHAFHRMRDLLPPQSADGTVAYLGFPWATLIDLKLFATHRPALVARLEAALADLAMQLAGYDRVLTVCQHVHMRDFADLFARAGVTDIYWAHAVRDQQQLPEAPAIRLHAFPLYPVQQAVPAATRDLLFSFVGAGSHPKYLSQARGHIVTLLSDDPRGHVTETRGWHYAKVVYDRQIMDRAGSDAVLTDTAAAERFRAMLARSTFALCPSGTGPNSIRLWEAVASGVIPVVLAQTYRPPGDAALWDAATLTCAETPEAIAALPHRLEIIAANPAELNRKQQAVAALTTRYGPDRFVHDILGNFFAMSLTPPDLIEPDKNPKTNVMQSMTLPASAQVRLVLRKAWAAIIRFFRK